MKETIKRTITCELNPTCIKLIPVTEEPKKAKGPLVCGAFSEDTCLDCTSYYFCREHAKEGENDCNGYVQLRMSQILSQVADLNLDYIAKNILCDIPSLKGKGYEVKYLAAAGYVLYNSCAYRELVGELQLFFSQPRWVGDRGWMKVGHIDHPYTRLTRYEIEILENTIKDAREDEILRFAQTYDEQYALTISFMQGVDVCPEDIAKSIADKFESYK